MSARRLPFNDLAFAGTELEKDVGEAIGRVLASSRYVLGPEVSAFEEEFARAVSCRAAVGVASGTDALMLALEALGVAAGDEVITSPMTAAFTALAISRMGATPVFADVEPDTLTLSVTSVEKRITARTRAIVPVHLYGNACDMDAMLAIAGSERLILLEDACQAHGASLGGRFLGSMGDAGAFSFYPTKNLGALGDGGMIVTGDADLAARLKRLRNGGQSSRYRHQEIGVNSRLDEIQAAVLRAKLTHLSAWNERRRALATRYENAFRGTPISPVAVRPGSESARHLMVIRAPRRDELLRFLDERGIETLIHYPVPVHQQPAYRHLGAEGSCPVAEEAAKSIVSLPLYPSMSDEDADRVAATALQFYA